MNPQNQQRTDEPKRLWDEYKLIQEKIDKIGEFQFKVKGWSATLLGAFVYGGFKTSQLGIALVGGLGIAFLFHITEKRQRAFSKALGERALELERAFQSFPPVSNSRLWDAVVQRTPQMRHTPAVARALARTGLSGWWVTHSNEVFYWLQYALLMTLLFGYLTNFSLQRLGGPSDPKPRYELSFGRYRMIIYRSN